MASAVQKLGELTPESLRGMSAAEFAETEEKGKIAKERETKAAGERAGRTEAEFYKAYGGALTQPFEKFSPTQETASGFAAIGTLMMVAGGMMGSSGKLSGIGAMNNIAGMMEGYRTGRKDLYEQERQMFEENMKVQEKNRALIKEAFDQALKVAKYDLTGAKNMLEQRLGSLGATIPQQMVKTSGVVPAAAMFNQVDENYKKIAGNVQKAFSQQDLIRIEEARRKAASAAEIADIDLQTKKAALKKAQAESERGGLTAAEVKAETDRQDLAKALYADYQRTNKEPVIKDEKLLGAYKKLYPEAPFKTTEKQLTDEDVMSDSAAKFRVERFLAGDKSAATGFGLGDLGQKNKNKFEEVLAKEAENRGISGKQLSLIFAEYEGIKAQERTLGTRTAYIELAAAELKQLIPTLEQASANVPRGSFIPITKLMQTAEASLSDPKLIKLRTAINGVQQAYVRALSPTGTPTDLLRRKADDLFSAAVDQEGIQAALDQMNIEVNAALTAPDAVKEIIQKRYGGGSTTTTAPPPVSNVQSAGPKEGDTDVSKSGRAIIFRNGKWEYQ